MSKQMEKSALGKKSSGVVLKEITKIFQQPDTGKDFVAVDHINLNIQDGEMVTLLGPSGCGKTTTLRMISGFEYPTSGSVFIGERDVAKIPPNKRGISMVFQSYALFPHLNIWENVAYGLKVAKVSQDPESLPWARVGDMKEGLLCETENYLTKEGVDQIPWLIVPEGAVLLSVSGTIGKSAIAGCDLDRKSVV